MSRLYRFQCSLFDRLLSLQGDDLLAGYGDEIRIAFRDDLRGAWRQGALAVVGIWTDVIAEVVALNARILTARLQLILAATILASTMTLGTALGFCTLGSVTVVRACTQESAERQPFAASQPAGSLVQLQNGLHMFLECSGLSDGRPTVILATGRGLGTADSWKLVQQDVSPSIRICSYDTIGAGRSDKIPGPHPIDQVVSEMHDLFELANLRKPYVLVGISAGGVLVRRYQQQYPAEVGGLVFVDSSHEEMLWRDAAIAPQMVPDWSNPTSLQKDGFLPDQKRLTWRADIPLIVLERSEKVPQEAFPNLTSQQIDGINAAWHSFQVDITSRSKYGQLRVVDRSGHAMQQQRPDAIANAIQDVVHQVQSKR
jgi:pimeloyl-ACP methyl ester carboxylesterase